MKSPGTSIRFGLSNGMCAGRWAVRKGVITNTCAALYSTIQIRSAALTAWSFARQF